MTRLRSDPDLPVPDDATTPDRIGMVEGALSLAGRAGARTFLAGGAAVVLAGPERGPIESVVIRGRPCAAEIAADVGPAVNVVAAPSMVRREHVDARGSVVETLLAAPSLPLAAVQWAVPPGALALGRREIGLTLLPGAERVRYRTEAGTVTASDEDRPDEIVVAALRPPPREWRVLESGDRGLVLRAATDADGPVTLLLAAGPEGRARAALAAGAHVTAQERLAQTGEDELGLAVLSGVPEIDDAIAWARKRVWASLAHPESGPAEPQRLFWTALGAMASGDGDSALAALALLEGRDTDATQPSPSRSGPGGLVLPPGPLLPFVAACLALTLDETAAARRQGRALDAVRLRELHACSDEPTWALWSLTLELLADALRHGAPPAEIQRLRDAAALPALNSTRRVRLPVVGTSTWSERAGVAGLLRLLLRRGAEESLRPSFTPQESGASDLLDAWYRVAAGEPEPGWALWRAAVSAGLQGALGPRGTWDGPDGPRCRGAPGAAAVVGGMVHGILGLTPDAPAGRLELSPAFPSHLRRFEASNLPAGKCRFTLSYERSRSAVRYAVEPTRGRVPPSLVLAPTVPCESVGTLRVDGARADLDVHHTAAGVRVLVQVPLDGPRSLEIETP